MFEADSNRMDRMDRIKERTNCGFEIRDYGFEIRHG
jgi:hypothetical protein